MKVTIEISDNYVPILRKWASVSRTLNAAKNVITNATHEDQEQAIHTWDELNIINPPLNALHKAFCEGILKEEENQRREDMYNRAAMEDFDHMKYIDDLDGG